MKGNADSSYQTYNAMVNQTAQGLHDLEDICESLQMQEHIEQLRSQQQRMQNQTFSVGIMGEFRRGKSTVINALLGTDIVPSDVVPTSATLNYIRWDATPRAVVNFKDGRQKDVAVEQLKNYITKTTKENEQMAATVEDAKVYYPCRFCQNGVQIIDTPGLNDDARMTEIAEKVIPTLDAVVLVMTAEIPFSESEAKFVREKIMLSDLGRVIFVVNKIDLVRQKADRARLLDTIRGRITESVLDKMAMVYGRDSEEYRGAADKMGGIRIFGVCAIDALEGRMSGDEEMVEKSGILEFEAALSKMLTEERGMLELAGPVNSILSVSRQAENVIAMRRSAQTIDREALERTCEEGMQATRSARDRAQEEMQSLKRSAAALSQELLPDVESAYAGVEQSLLQYADEVEITSEEMKTDKKAEARAQAISEEMRSMAGQQLNAAAQVLLAKMQTRIGEDLAALEDAGNEIFADVVQVQEKLLTGGNDNRGKAMDIGLAAASLAVTNTMPLFGLGAMYNGWKEQGIPGALVGGGVGLAAGVIAAQGTAAAACAILGVSMITGIATLPFLAIGGLASTIAGKNAVSLIFKNRDRQIRQLREQLRSYVAEIMQAVRKDRVPEHWLRDTSASVYEAVSNRMDEEVEATLMNFERQLVQMQADRDRQSGEMDAILQDMDTLEQELKELETRLQPVRAKLQAALTAPAA